MPRPNKIKKLQLDFEKGPYIVEDGILYATYLDMSDKQRGLCFQPNQAVQFLLNKFGGECGIDMLEDFWVRSKKKPWGIEDMKFMARASGMPITRYRKRFPKAKFYNPNDDTGLLYDPPDGLSQSEYIAQLTQEEARARLYEVFRMERFLRMVYATRQELYRKYQTQEKQLAYLGEQNRYLKSLLDQKGIKY